MVELAGGLVEPTGPCAAVVDRNYRPLIDAEDAALRMVGIDPELMIVIASGRSLDRHKVLSAVGGTVDVDVDRVDRIGIFRLDGHAAEVPAARPDTRVAAGARPVRSAVITPVHAALRGIDDCVDAPRAGRRNGDSDVARFRRKPVSDDLGPVIAAVRRFEKTAAGTIRRRIDAPRRAARLPERGVENIRIARLEGEVDRAGVVVVVAREHALPRRSAIL